MSEVQFTAVVLLSLMALALVILLPSYVGRDRVMNRSRWLMTAALALLAVQFLLQHSLKLRQMGVTQAVELNLVFFIPCSALLGLSVLNLQRQGRLSRMERWAAVPTWVAAMACLLWAETTDGQPLLAQSERMLWAEIAASIIYAIMQIYYFVLQMRELVRLQHALDNYYDRERGKLLNWFRLSVGVLALMALSVPMLIFVEGWTLAMYAVLFFAGIFYVWFCFVRYVISHESLRVREADREEQRMKDEERVAAGSAHTATNTETLLTESVRQHIDMAVEQWLAAGGHLKNGLTSPIAADAMGIPRYQLTEWVKTSGYASFSRWIVGLRIEEAKRTLLAHSDWSNETVADHCGFSRSHFQKTFKKETGFSPSEFLEANRTTTQSET
jgi:AraC-like DNA-binding protein